VEFSPVTHGERILVVSLCFWSLIVIAAYTANLASELISKKQANDPSVAAGLPVCVTKGLAISSKLKKSYPNANIIEVEGLYQKYDHLFEGKCDLVADYADTFETARLNKTLNPDCSLEWVGRAVDVGSGGPANIVDAGVYCTSLVGNVFDYYMEDMHRDGFIEKAKERLFNSVATHSCPKQAETEASPDAEESSQLTMVDMGGIFLVHGIACVLGLLISYTQRCWDRRTKEHDSGVHQNEITDDYVSIDTEEDIVCLGDGIVSSQKIGSGYF